MLYQDKHILINRIPLEYDNAINGAVLTTYEFSEVEKIEKKLRKHVYSKGHVARYNFNDIDGSNAVLRRQINNAKKFAPLDMTVLIEGETGTGKELMAHAIHNASKRKNGPFVAINCAALPKDLLESELFGFEEGTFTGARKGGKPGLFEQAHLGTIFLDEIGEIPPEIQVKLLRAIEAKEVMRIGSDGLISVDVRIIAATNQNLKSLIAAKKFREDLYFRLNVLKVYIPPLRERKEDILPLMNSMLGEYGKSVNDFLTEEVRQLLTQYNWPGNIRELRNIAEFLIATVPDRKAKGSDLPIDFQVNIDLQSPGEKPISIKARHLFTFQYFSGLVIELKLFHILGCPVGSGFVILFRIRHQIKGLFHHLFPFSLDFVGILLPPENHLFFVDSLFCLSTALHSYIYIPSYHPTFNFKLGTFIRWFTVLSHVPFLIQHIILECICTAPNRKTKYISV